MRYRGSSFLRRSSGDRDDGNGRKGIFNKLPSLRIPLKRKTTSDVSKAATTRPSPTGHDLVSAHQSLGSNVAPLSSIALGIVEPGSMLARVTSSDVVPIPIHTNAHDKNSAVPMSADTNVPSRLNSPVTAGSSGQWTAITTPESAGPRGPLSAAKEAGVLPSIASKTSTEDEDHGMAGGPSHEGTTDSRKGSTTAAACRSQATQSRVEIADPIEQVPDLTPLYPKIEAQAVELSKHTKEVITKEIEKTSRLPIRKSMGGHRKSTSVSSNSELQLACLGNPPAQCTKDDASKIAFGGAKIAAHKQHARYYAKDKAADDGATKKTNMPCPSREAKFTTYKSTNRTPSVASGSAAARSDSPDAPPMQYPGHDTWSYLPFEQKRKAGARIAASLSTFNWSTALQRRQPVELASIGPGGEVEDHGLQTTAQLSDAEKRHGRVFLLPHELFGAESAGGISPRMVPTMLPASTSPVEDIEEVSPSPSPSYSSSTNTDSEASASSTKIHHISSAPKKTPSYKQVNRGDSGYNASVTETSSVASIPGAHHYRSGSIDLNALNSAQAKAASFEKMSSKRNKSSTTRSGASKTPSTRVNSGQSRTDGLGSVGEEEEERELTLWRTNSQAGGDMFSRWGNTIRE